MLPSPTFCALPFGQLFLSEEGKSFPCCYALESLTPNKDSEGRVIEVRSEGDLEKAWNSVSQRSIRQQMMRGERPESCRRCFSFEDSGLHSLRQVANFELADEIPRAVENLRDDGSMPSRFFSLDLRFGNLCNLRCQMCSPVSSRKLVEDFKLFYPEAGEDYRQFQQLDWFRSPNLREAILGRAHELRQAHFAGGEPFLIPEVETFVTDLAALPGAAGIRLSFNTNGTHLPLRLFEQFPRFQGVKLIVSLDGLGEVNDYIRFPSRFAAIEANLRLLHENRDRWNLSLVCFNFTAQAHNIFHLPEMLRYLKREFPGFFPFPFLGPLQYPRCLSLRVLPPGLKMRAREMIEALVREELESWKQAGKKFNVGRDGEAFGKELLALVAFMEAEDWSGELPEFQRFSSAVEKIRGFSLPVPGLT